MKTYKLRKLDRAEALPMIAFSARLTRILVASVRTAAILS